MQLVQLEKHVQGLLALAVPHSSLKLREVEAAREAKVSHYMLRVNYALFARYCTALLVLSVRLTLRGSSRLSSPSLYVSLCLCVCVHVSMCVMYIVCLDVCVHHLTPGKAATDTDSQTEGAGRQATYPSRRTPQGRYRER